MKKVLYLSHIEPFPAASGDRVRLSQQLRRLADEHCVDAVVISHSPEAPLIKEFLPEINSEKRFYIPKINRYARALSTFFNNRPEAVNHFRHKKVADYIRSVAAKYDMIFCASTVMAQYVMDISGIPKLLDATDSLTMNYIREAKKNSFLKKDLLMADARRMKEFESLCLKNFDRIAYISPVDRDYIPDYPEKKFIVGNSVKLADIKDVNTHQRGEKNPELTFLGMMSYKPNIYAMKFFTKSVFPLILNQYPNTQLVIAGGNPAPEIKEMESKNIRVTGYLADLTPVFKDCTIFIAPLLTGAGIQNKILQAMAHECCVVTTRFGAEGLDANAGLIVCNKAESMAATICNLISDSARCSRMGTAAREYVAENFSEERITEEFRHFINI